LLVVVKRIFSKLLDNGRVDGVEQLLLLTHLVLVEVELVVSIGGPIQDDVSVHLVMEHDLLNLVI